MLRAVRKTMRAWVLSGGIFLLGPGVASAEFSFVSQSATYLPEQNAISFSVEFNQSPDLVTTNAFNGVANAFQYYVRNDLDLPYPDYYDSIIRVEPSFITAGLLVARSPSPASSDAGSGGWGSVRGTSLFQLDGRTLTFEMPVNVLSDHDPLFSYEFATFEYGELTQQVTSAVVASIPEPGTVVLLAVGLALLAFLSNARHKEVSTSSPMLA